MRYLLALMLLSLGLGTVLNSSQVNLLGDETFEVWEASHSAPSTVNGKLVVDRGDDPEAILPCTGEAADCSLRSAIDLANKDGVATEITFSDHLFVELSRPLPALVEEGTTIKAATGIEVHVDGNGSAGTLFEIFASNIRIEGLRLYGAGAGMPLVKIGGQAQNVAIARNIIGDDDAPPGSCGLSDGASAGIHVVAEVNTEAPQSWITGNIIECINGAPGVGVLVESGRIVMGKDSQGHAAQAQQNTIRSNAGHGIYLGANSGSVICNNLIQGNRGDAISVANFNNDIMENTIED